MMMTRRDHYLLTWLHVILDKLVFICALWYVYRVLCFLVVKLNIGKHVDVYTGARINISRRNV